MEYGSGRKLAAPLVGAILAALLWRSVFDQRQPA